MLINHFNSLLDGGAATAGRRLHAELLKSGVQSRYYYSSSQGHRDDLDPSYIRTRWRGQGLLRDLAAYVRFRKERRSLKQLTRCRPTGHEVFNSPSGAAHTPWPPIDHSISDNDAIVHLHWIAKFLDYQSFFGSLDSSQPIVWTLHDMNPMTGGCHFTDGCTGFQSGCGDCPQLPPTSSVRLPSVDNPVPVADASRRFFLQKQSALRDANLHVVAPSRWLLDSARSSKLLGQAKSFTCIPYGLSIDQYFPMSRVEARARLGIDPDVTLFCFGAMDVKSRRKGVQELMQALSHVAELPDVEGLVFGSGKLSHCDHPLPKIHEVGPIHGTLAQRTVYSAADAFVLPSLEDNLPLTGLEAMACGTAVIGFDVGGIPDYVRPGQTGMLAKAGDAEDLGRQLRQLMTDPRAAATMGANARRRIESEFTSAREASAYRSLYAALLAGEASGSAAA